MALETTSYPESPRVPRAENVSGVTFDDPYVWLEEDTPDVLRWQEEQNSVAEAHLHAWPHFERLRGLLVAHATDATVVAPRHHGRYWFRTDLPGGGEMRSALQVADDVRGPWRTLVDPNAIESEQAVTLDWYHPSPDGKRVAYGLSEGGGEESTLHIIDTETGQVLPERIAYTSGSFVAWLPDGTAFYYTGTEGPHTQNPGGRVYFHRVGETDRPKPEPLEYDDLMFLPQVSNDGRYAAVLAGHLQLRPRFIRELPDGEWRPFILQVEGTLYGCFVGDEYVAVTTEGAARGRVVAIPVGSGTDRSTWRELVPGSDTVLQSISRVGDRLVLGSLVDVQARLDILGLDGTYESSVPVPEASVVGQSSSTASISWFPMIAASTGATDFTFVQQSLRGSAGIYRYDVASGQLDEVAPPARLHRHFRIDARFCASTGGARVPYFVLHREDVDITRPQPALIHAYGGFNIATLPGYQQMFVEFVEAGGLFVLVHARGGSEFGSEWWMDGRAAVKQHTFDDVYAAVEDLVAAGMTAPDRTGFAGFSNGGLLAGAVIAQRPDLFRVAVPGIPILDLLHVTRDPLTHRIAQFEYGDPNVPEQAEWLYAYSPYHNLRDGIEYPAALLVTGASDVRCPAWHSRKFVARLQTSTASGRPVLMRVLDDVGHFTGMSPKETSETTAEFLGFIMEQVGLAPRT